MNAPAPEAENEYSKGAGRLRARRGRKSPGGAGTSWAIAALGAIGAALLIAAEFAPLYTLHLSTYGTRPSTVSTGSHNAYALVPLALAAAVLAAAWVRAGSRAAVGALGAIGVIALVIALGVDLPDTRARGIAHGLAFASTTAAAGLYLETLGAVALLAAGGAGLLTGLRAEAPLSLPRVGRRPARPRSTPPAPRRSGGESAS